MRFRSPHFDLENSPFLWVDDTAPFTSHEASAAGRFVQVPLLGSLVRMATFRALTVVGSSPHGRLGYFSDCRFFTIDVAWERTQGPSSLGALSAALWLDCPRRSLRFTRFSLLPNDGNPRRLLRGVVGFSAEADLRDQTPSILCSDATRPASD
jgi:hypothetical protein